MRGTVPQSLLMCSCPFCYFPGRYSIFIYDIQIFHTLLPRFLSLSFYFNEIYRRVNLM